MRTPNSDTSVAIRSLMAFGDLEPDDEYMEKFRLDVESCSYCLKATREEVVEHLTDWPQHPKGHDYYGHPIWCGPCEGYNVNGVWVDCDPVHEHHHRQLWEMHEAVAASGVTWARR